MGQLTPLAFIALGMLAERPMHPYEMFQTMTARRDDRNVKIRPGTLYHQVGKLAENGYVEEVGTDREGRRPERTTYSITDAGRGILHHCLVRMLSQPAEEYPEFNVALAEIENLTLDQAVAALEDRLATLCMEAGLSDQLLEQVKAKQLPERYYLDSIYSRHQLAAQIDFIESLLGRLRAGEIPWDSAVPAEHAEHTAHAGHPGHTEHAGDATSAPDPQHSPKEHS